MLEKRLIQFLSEDNQIMNDLKLVRQLDLPQSYIAAGYIRNYVWDRLHGYGNRRTYGDIDVIYYDPQDISEERDRLLEDELKRSTGNDKWSVKNQARMHIRNEASPYLSTLDALKRWPETATAVGAMLDQTDQFLVCAPHGLEDLFKMVVRRSPFFSDQAYYLERVGKKEWDRLWPLLTIVEE
ncbi:nucleotidyltransferase family protein [Paenibacillus sp. D2_2]|uniref:nucleotidyltransferase family protein n=1 Tax=Paenibacillus sp. D2_2 TaxID=3073092 RepID=UPI0028165221|nr:nucleotidyltransferase family protein [Paenibacillus sp. D2_2]WMT43007.1 nucleotidyltransferase family protein [Paenibacillus sp. D2_2]